VIVKGAVDPIWADLLTSVDSRKQTRVIRHVYEACMFQALRERLRGPVGIDIGAVTPEGIALAIVAEVHAWLAERPVVASSQRPDAAEPARAARIHVSRE